MWDNAALLRNIANALIFCSVCALLYGAAYYAVHLPGLFPLRNVRLTAAPQRVNPEQVLQGVRDGIQGNFFTVDIEHLRQVLEKLPWVRKVSIRREFPYRLAVELEEHQPLARWGDNSLVNPQGEIFTATTGQALPMFIGPDGTAAEVTQYYLQFARQLAVLNLQPLQVTLSQRHAWQLQLNNGMLLELGREDMQPRLARFVQVYPYSLAALQSRVKVVDLRYRNGFAVRGLAKQG